MNHHHPAATTHPWQLGPWVLPSSIQLGGPLRTPCKLQFEIAVPADCSVTCSIEGIRVSPALLPQGIHRLTLSIESVPETCILWGSLHLKTECLQLQIPITGFCSPSQRSTPAKTRLVFRIPPPQQSRFQERLKATDYSPDDLLVCELPPPSPPPPVPTLENSTLISIDHRAASARNTRSATGPWFYSDHRAKRGPLSSAQLSERLANGTLPLHTLLWCNGMNDWAPANTIHAFRNAKACPSTTTPPPADFYLASSGRWLGPFLREVLLQRSASGTLQPNDILLPVGAAHYAEASTFLPFPSFKDPRHASEGPFFKLRSRNQITGGLTHHDILQMSSTGAARPEDHILREGESQWTTVRELLGLAEAEAHLSTPSKKPRQTARIDMAAEQTPPPLPMR